jgi:predicted nucleic-acid-binding Zn-ribbon protein
MGLWKGFKRGMKAVFSSNVAGYEAGGRRVRCPHCHQQDFVQGEAQLNTAGMTFVNLDWANKSATTLMCGHCGLMRANSSPTPRSRPGVS